MPANPRPDAAFRLDLEQQKKRARELLVAARKGDAKAWRRLRASVPAFRLPASPETLQLAAAQLE
jgi:hypothetical protein